MVAYGTKFNVNAYADEPFIEAVLEKGKIDVIRNDERIRLEPNKQAVLDKESGTFSVSAANLEEKMDWKGGRIVFRNTSLDKVLKRLEKRYNVEIVLHKSGNAEYKYRATFTTETLEQILDYLKTDCSYRMDITRAFATSGFLVCSPEDRCLSKIIGNLY